MYKLCKTVPVSIGSRITAAEQFWTWGSCEWVNLALLQARCKEILTCCLCFWNKPAPNQQAELLHCTELYPLTSRLLKQELLQLAYRNKNFSVKTCFVEEITSWELHQVKVCNVRNYRNENSLGNIISDSLFTYISSCLSNILLPLSPASLQNGWCLGNLWFSTVQLQFHAQFPACYSNSAVKMEMLMLSQSFPSNTLVSECCANTC